MQLQTLTIIILHGGAGWLLLLLLEWASTDGEAAPLGACFVPSRGAVTGQGGIILRDLCNSSSCVLCAF